MRGCVCDKKRKERKRSEDVLLFIPITTETRIKKELTGSGDDIQRSWKHFFVDRLELKILIMETVVGKPDPVGR